MASFSRAKKLIFIRHGVTEMNEALEGVEWGAPGFVDCQLWDTKLTDSGVRQATNLNSNLADRHGNTIDTNEIELLVSSPLKRALHTADLVYSGKLSSSVARLAHPLFRERLYMSSEVGKQKHVISEEHPEWNYDHLPDNENWWYEHTCDEHRENYVEWRKPLDGIYCCPGEPYEEFRSRLVEARQWLLDRPEQCIALVSHWGVLMGLTGKSFHNCEVMVLSSDELLAEPKVDD